MIKMKKILVINRNQKISIKNPIILHKQHKKKIISKIEAQQKIKVL